MNTPQAPHYRLAYAAQLAGLTPELFLSACQLGQIPVSVNRLGKRGLWYVHGAELMAFLGPKAPESLRNLFVTALP